MIYIYSSLTATRTTTFLYIEWTPDIDLSINLLDIVFGKYARRGMEKTATKNAE